MSGSQNAFNPNQKKLVALLLATILLGAFFLRLFHHFDMQAHNPVYEYPIIDAKEYTNNAEFIAETSWLGPSWPYFHPPLYTYFIAVLYWLFGTSITLVRILQIVLDVCNTLLIFVIARRVFDTRVALISSVLYALYLPMIMFSTELLPPVLSIFLLLCTLLFLGVCLGKSRYRTQHILALCGAGLSYGLLVVTLPNFLVCLPLIAILLFIYTRPMNMKHRVMYTALFLVIALVPAGATTIRNMTYTGEPVFIAYNGGVNFYIGNNPDINNTVGIPPGVEWEKFTMEPYEDERVENFSQSSNYWYRRGFNYIIHNPIEWIWLMIKKTVFFFNAHEFPRNFDIAFFSAYSSIMQFPVVRLNVLLALGLCGVITIAAHWRDMKRKRELVLFATVVAGYSFSIILFFVAARYRLPIIPFFAIAAAYGIFFVIHNASRTKRIFFLVLACVLFGAVSLKPFAYNYPYAIPKTKTYALIGATLFDQGHDQEAVHYLQTGLEYPDDEYTYDLLHQLGLIYSSRGNTEQAIHTYQTSLRHKPNNFSAWNDLGSEYMTRGSLDSALICYERARQLAPCCAKVYLNLVEVFFAAQEHNMIIPVLESYFDNCPSPHPIISYTLGKFYMQIHHDWDQAVYHIEQALKYPHGFELTGDVFNNLGICYYYQNRFDKAEQMWKKGLRLEPDNESLQNNLEKLERFDNAQE